MPGNKIPSSIDIEISCTTVCPTLISAVWIGKKI